MVDKVYIVAFYTPHNCGGEFSIDSTDTHVASTFDKAVAYCKNNLNHLINSDMYYSICCEEIDSTKMSGGAQIAIVTKDGTVNDFRKISEANGYLV